MNYGDAVYGGMFISATYTQAFFAKNIREVVENGLKTIPPQLVEVEGAHAVGASA
jgi:hypothetical protein